ncbi:unnamed protein product [Cunninghamella blakesleeana]
MKKQQHHHHRGASTSSIVNKEFFIPLHRSITDNHEEKRQQEKHRSPIAKFVCKLLGIDSHRHHPSHHHHKRPRLDHKSNSTTSITKSSVIQISSNLSAHHPHHPSNNHSVHLINKEQEDNCSIHSSASASSFISASISSSTSSSNKHSKHSKHPSHHHKHKEASSSSSITSKPLESSLSSLTDSVMTTTHPSTNNDCILIHPHPHKEYSFHHYNNPIKKNDQLSAMDALVMASQLPTVRRIQFVDDALDMPPPTLTDRLSSTNAILNEPLAEQLRPYLPRRYRLAGEWNLLYSLDQHGASLSTLYNHVDESGPCILILKDDEHQVFGAFLNEYLHPETSYYGTGECFLWKMASNDKQQQNNHHPIPKIKTFSFTGRNDYMIYSTLDCIAIGGGHGKFGLWLNKDLEKCHSEPCDTFDNECLSLNHHFNCIGLEIWSFRF